MRLKKSFQKVAAASLITALSLGFAQPVLAESASDTTLSTTTTAASTTTTTTTTASSTTTTKAGSNAEKYVVITGSSVNLRSGAGTSFAKVGKTKKGSRFAYLSSKKAKDGKIWYQIQYSSSKTAWVISSYSRIEKTPSKNTENTSSQKTVVITGSNVNLRIGAGTSFAKAGTAKNGSKFVFLSSEKGKDGKIWYQIQYSSTETAWVIGSYARIECNPSKQYVIINGGEVNLRTGAGTSYAKAGTAKKGEKFVYLSSKKAKDDKLWYQVQYTSSKKAWVSSSYAKRANNDDSFSPYLTRTITIKKGSKPVYSEPDSESKRMGKVSGGKKYTVIEWGDNGKTTWYAFKLKGKKVWISRNNVTVSDQFKSIPTKDFSDGSVPMIYLSPSKQPENDYAAGNTNEQKQMYRVAAELQKILEEEYICAVYTAPTDLFLSPDGRALDAYNRHADVYLAIHSNSDDSRSKKSYGAVGYYQPQNPQSKKLAENMVKEMGKIAPRKSNVSPKTVNGMKAFDGTGYADVREPVYYGITSILAEVEYHDNADSAKWIINNPKKIARALANSLEATFRLQRR